MLPFTTLQSSELATFGGETATSGATTQMSAAPSSSFSDALRGAGPGAAPQASGGAGQTLPAAGSSLPGLALADTEPLRDLLPHGWGGEGSGLFHNGRLPPVVRLFSDRSGALEDSLRAAADVLPPFPVGPDELPIAQGDADNLPDLAVMLDPRGQIPAWAAASAAPGGLPRDWIALRDALRQQGVSADDIAALEQGLKRGASLLPGGTERDGQLPVIRMPEAAQDARLARMAQSLDPDGLLQALAQASSARSASGEALLAENQGQRQGLRGPASVQQSFAGLLHMPVQMSRTDMAATQLPTLQIDLPVSDAEWGQSLNDRIMWMADNRMRRAEIRLHPAEMGPLRVKISVEDGTANVSFHAHHAVTRDAIEQALPRLREMLAESGLGFGEASVSDGNVPDHQAEVEQRSQAGNRDPGDDPSGGDEDHSVAVRQRREGLVDTFV